LSNLTNLASDWVAIALLGKPRGNRGELTAISLTSKPERFDSVERVYLSGHDEPFAVEEIWDHNGSLIFKLEGIDSITDAERYRDCEVRVPMSERTDLDPGEYFHSDLIGCQVIDLSTGNSIGTVADIQDAAGGGLLVIGDDILIPFTSGLCKVIDVANRRIEVEVPEGLLDINRP
jgi:16S rRNA processing protein RimM